MVPLARIRVREGVVGLRFDFRAREKSAALCFKQERVWK